MIRATLLLAALFMLSACHEPSQSQADARNSGDVPAWKGANDAFMAPGWKPGDKSVWEKQLHQRAQTQNEYLKVD
jgi:hypothetical protein